MPLPSNQRPDLPDPIAEAVCLLADRLPAEPITWCVGGSVARWLRGFHVTPKDIDLDTGADYLDDITARLRDYELSPPAITDPERFPSKLGVYQIGGVRIDLIVDCQIRARDLHFLLQFARCRDRITLFPLRGRAIPVLPLEESLLANIVMDR